jgi:hypothetical protein
MFTIRFFLLLVVAILAATDMCIAVEDDFESVLSFRKGSKMLTPKQSKMSKISKSKSMTTFGFCMEF